MRECLRALPGLVAGVEREERLDVVGVGGHRSISPQRLAAGGLQFAGGAIDHGVEKEHLARLLNG